MIRPSSNFDSEQCLQTAAGPLDLILRLHGELIESLEWSGERLSYHELEQELPGLISQFCETRLDHLNPEQRAKIEQAILAESIGLGPLQPLFADRGISDILVNGPHEVFIERAGRLEKTEIQFAGNEHLLRIIQRIAASIGRRIDESSPMVDARLKDGSRVHAVVPPLAIQGPTLSIRRFGHKTLTSEDLVNSGTMTGEMFEFLAAAIESRLSFLISGGTGAGKTTLLNALSQKIPHDERVVTIEDTAELRLQHPHVISLETRTANAEGVGSVTIRELVKNSLRMRPDRILIGEVRGSEAIDLLQALNTGHEGSLCTIHANEARDALTRLEIMVGMNGYDFPVSVLRQYITAGIKLLVHVGRLKGGIRRVMQIAEIVGIESGEYKIQEIFGYRVTGVDSKGNSQGEFYTTGYVPKCLQRMNATGIIVRRQIFGATENEIKKPSTITHSEAIPATPSNIFQPDPQAETVASPATKPRKLRFKVASVALESSPAKPVTEKHVATPKLAEVQQPIAPRLEHDLHGALDFTSIYEPIILGLQPSATPFENAKQQQAKAIDHLMSDIFDLEGGESFDLFDKLTFNPKS